MTMKFRWLGVLLGSWPLMLGCVDTSRLPTSVRAESSNDYQAAVYASIDSADPDRVVIVAINRTEEERDTRIELAHPTAFRSAAVYRITAQSPTIEPDDAIAVGDSSFIYPMPGHSVSVIVPAP